MKDITIVVRCGGHSRALYSTLASIHEASVPPAQTVVVTDVTTPVRAVEWIQAFATQRGITLVNTTCETAGASLNAALAASLAPYVMTIDAGTRLARTFLARAASILDEQSDVGLVSPANASAASDVSLSALAADSDLIHAASMFRRTAWKSLGGFAETLPALVRFELWLRILATGSRCAVVRGASVSGPHQYKAAAEQDRERDLRLAAMSLIFSEHASIFRREAPAVLYEQECALRGLDRRHRTLLGLRDEGLTEMRRLETRARELHDRLSLASEQDNPEALDLADLRRTTPIDDHWGFNRGKPIDRHYIEAFLASYAADIWGHVLEVKDSEYTRVFGGLRVTRSDIVDVDPSNDRATVVSDLRSAANIPAESYDCILLTQTLQFIDDVESTLRECRRILKPGGVLLATWPMTSRVASEREADYWRVTASGARSVFQRVFEDEELDIRCYGNVLTATAFLYGLACHEISGGELAAADSKYPLIVGVRAQKPAKRRREAISAATLSDALRVSGSGLSGVVLLYHRVNDLEDDIHGLAVSPKLFRSHMAYVARRCRPVTLSDMVRSARAGDLNARSVAVTFDDGYLDNLLIAAPMMTAYAVPATFFIVAGGVCPPPSFWWDILARALLSDRTVFPDGLRLQLPGGQMSFPTTSVGERIATHAAIYRAIVAESAEIQDAIALEVSRWSGASCSRARDARMDDEAIRALADIAGQSIGAHTVTHPLLPLQSHDVRAREISESRRTLERILQRPITAFAYPFGAWSQETETVLREASFDLAVCGDERLAGADVNALRVPRFAVSPSRAAAFEDWIESLFAGDPAALRP